MKKWKHLLKAVMAVGVIAMTAVQICAAAEGTAQAAVSEVTPVSISTNEISGIRFDLFRYRLFLLVAPAGDKRYRSREDHDFILHSRFV